MKSTIIAVIMLLVSAAAHSQLLKCIRSDGSVEYSNQCPPGSKQQPVGIQNAPAQAAPEAKSTGQKSLAEQEAEFRKRQAERQEAQAKEEKKAAQDAERARACASSRAYLKSLEARARVVKNDPKTGERIFLDEAGYESEIAATRRSIEANCK